MKKLLLVICILFSIALNAQTDFYFGPKIGYKESGFKIKKTTMPSDGSKLTFGVYGRLLFDKFVIQPELMYNYMAIDLNEGKDFVLVTISKNHSFALPIYFGYQFIHRNNFNMRANIGPVVHFNFDKCIYTEPDYELIPYLWDYNFANLGAAFSLGADIYRFTIDLGYSLGLTNVFRNENNKLRQNTLTFSVGYRFGK